VTRLRAVRRRYVPECGSCVSECGLMGRGGGECLLWVSLACFSFVTRACTKLVVVVLAVNRQTLLNTCVWCTKVAGLGNVCIRRHVDRSTVLGAVTQTSHCYCKRKYIRVFLTQHVCVYVELVHCV
jgi:hypothetical protein